MIKRYLAPLVIRTPKQPHFIKIICLLAVIFGTQTVAVQLQITQDAHASSQQGAAVVQIPDPNLRAVIAEALGKSPNAPITVEEMERLGRLDAREQGHPRFNGASVCNKSKESVGSQGQSDF